MSHEKDNRGLFSREDGTGRSCESSAVSFAAAAAELLFVNGSPCSAQERMAITKMEQYVNNSDCKKLEIDEVEVCSLGPEYSDVDVKHVLRTVTREGRFVFEDFSVKARGEHLVASKWRWDDCQRQRKRRKLGRKAKDVKRKISESGVPLMKMRRGKC